MSFKSLRRTLLAATLAASASFAAQAADPTPETLKLARELVSKTEGDRSATIASLSTPMVGMMQQMGITKPDRAQALVNEAMLPILNEHFDDLMNIQAKSYASILSADDLKGALAFYDSLAGKDFIKAQPQLAQSRLTGITQWIGALQPEMQTKIAAVMKAHGWDKG